MVAIFQKYYWLITKYRILIETKVLNIQMVIKNNFNEIWPGILFK